jgi:uncharacterized protein affecting Mg2+/Co2+ transport
MKIRKTGFEQTAQQVVSTNNPRRSNCLISRHWQLGNCAGGWNWVNIPGVLCDTGVRHNAEKF